ncbi:hypothetical protein IKF30_02955 [Candidatus Saccharibacteria bacterium]|nr:hypothetical protein [Candidatus Saccharibacteria bacterium]
MVFDLNGATIECNTGRFDFRKQFGEITDSLVKYDEESNTVTVDSRASESYAKYATIHECICCGRRKDLFPVEESLKRCGEIDKMLLSIMPESERETYIKKRIEMFEALLDRNLNPDLNDTFRCSLQTLKEVR